MAKPKAPFLSLGATGTVGQALTVSRRKGMHIAKRIPTHPDARSEAQLAQRQLYGEAIEAWRSLTPEQREALRPAAALLRLPIYQYFMHIYMMAVAAHHDTHELGGTDQVSVAGLSGVLADNQPVQVHGADKHTDVARQLFIPATTAVLSDATLSLLGDYGTVRMPDEANTVFAITAKVPDDFVSFTSIKLVWVSGAAAGNLYVAHNTSYAASTENRETHTNDTGFGTIATGGADIINVLDHPNPLTMPGLAKGDYIGIQTARMATVAQDSLNANVYALGILFSYTAEQ